MKRLWSWIVAFFTWLFGKRRTPVAFRWIGDNPMLLTIDQDAPLAVQAVDRAGNYTPLGNVVPQWTHSDPSVGTLTPAANGLSALFVSVAVGLTQVVVRATVDGNEIASDPLDLQVEPGRAYRLVLLPGVPVDKG
jgi:hypothetical protein